MKFSLEELLAGIRNGNHRAIARLITRIENGDDVARQGAASLRRSQGRAHVIGITGAPGAGKSTLVDQFVQVFRAKGLSVAVVAVDPSSPFSGGALLGDRIRMNHASEDPGVFIRSMATRGSLGGLSHATLEVMHVLDCAGFDIVLLETVGVGQAEVDVVRSADTCIVVLVPGMGDSVQIIKAGLMEIADIFAINKSDREGALQLEKDLYTLLSLAEVSEGGWKPPIIKSIATTGLGVSELADSSRQHLEWLENSGQGYARKLQVMRQNLVALASEWLARRALKNTATKIDQLAEQCVGRIKTPLEAANELVIETLAELQAGR
jgi:LAO/AO transport system kinase